MVRANMVYQSPLCGMPVAPQQCFEDFAMLQYGLNGRVAIQTLTVEQDVITRTVAIKFNAGTCIASLLALRDLTGIRK
jgi:hypothetical protein